MISRGISVPFFAILVVHEFVSFPSSTIFNSDRHPVVCVVSTTAFTAWKTVQRPIIGFEPQPRKFLQSGFNELITMDLGMMKTIRFGRVHA
jgi:hypothetical protein